MSRFVAMPALPDSGLRPWEVGVFDALIQNAQLLTGTRGETDLSSMAITRGDIQVNALGEPYLTAVNARGNGFNISGNDVASLAEFAILINDTAALHADVAVLRSTVNLLLQALKGT